MTQVRHLSPGEVYLCTGFVPAGYSESVIQVWVTRPKLARIVHQYLESDAWKSHCILKCGTGSMEAFCKGRMLRTFEAGVDPGLAFRVKHNLRMSCWWTVTRYESTFEEEDVRVYCDRFFECLPFDITCDEGRKENANIVRMGWDIECDTRSNANGKPLFPVANWNGNAYRTLAKTSPCKTT